jgi:hypothetical protein
VAVGGTFLEDRLIHRTSRGEAVRSKSEVIIANLLHAKRVSTTTTSTRWNWAAWSSTPTSRSRTTMPASPTTGSTAACCTIHAYRRRWQEKQQWYREHGILPLEQGGGPKGTLIVTRDQAGRRHRLGGHRSGDREARWTLTRESLPRTDQ